MERELTLREILAALLKRAEMVLICMLVCGFAGAGYGLLSAPTAEVQTKAAETYAAQLKQAEIKLKMAQEREEALETYRENSLYYALDPYNTAICTLRFFVDAMQSGDAAQAVRDADLTYGVATAYTLLYRDDVEMMKSIVDMLGEGIDIKYVAELIDVTAFSGNLIQITAVYKDTDTASEIAHTLFNALKTRVSETVGDHRTQMLSDTTVYCIDDGLLLKQETEEQLNTAHTESANAAKALQKLLRDPVTNDWQAVRRHRTIKYTAIGIAAGLVFGCCAALCAGMIGGGLESTADAERYGFPLLGVLPHNGRKRWFGGWIRRLENEPRISWEAGVAVLAANLDVVAKGKRIALCGTGDKRGMDALADGLRDAVFAAGNVLADAGAVEALQDADCVLLVETRGKSRMQALDEMVRRLKALQKDVIGIVLD